MAITRIVWNSVLLLCFLSAVLVASPPALAATPRSLSATVERVSDGDTVVAITANQTKLRIRLLGIDAPEIPRGKKPGQPYGQEARDYLDHLIGGKTVRVDVYGYDRYKRFLEMGDPAATEMGVGSKAPCVRF